MNSYDVAVCGGGPAGIMAAIAAARNGAKTILIERYGFLGGMATLSYVSPITTFIKKGKRIVGGIPLEFVQEMEKLGGADTSFPSGRVPFDPEVYKLVAQRMVLAAGATLLLHSYITGCTVHNHGVTAITVANKSGGQSIEAKYFIDCTGDADVVKLAGLPITPREKNESLQPMTLWFRMGGVDTEILENMEMRLEDVRSINMRIRNRLVELGAQEEVPQFGGPWMLTTLRNGEASINISRFAGDGTDVLSLTEAECLLREDVFRLAALLKNHFPEFAKAYILDVGAQVGIRETRQIDGLWKMSIDDILNSKDFPDTIAKGGHPIDIHLPDSNRQDLKAVEAGYNIPYRSLLPKGAENLMVAGRCLSATQQAFASVRVQATCMAMGQAAGTAAALCCRQQLAVHQLDGAALRGTLAQQGAVV